MDIISRQQAINSNLVQYFTGKPCKHGHITPRFTSSRICLGCNRIRSKKYHKENPEKSAEISKDWVRNNRERLREYQRQYYQDNQQSIVARKAAWKSLNPHVARHNSALRRARMLQATPSWADISLIRQFYYSCPEGYHVDHIIPLKGETVCGLHVINNLQYLPELENMSKGNKF